MVKNYLFHQSIKSIRWLLLCALSLTSYAHAQVQITLDKMTMEVGEQFQMVITSDQSGELDPNTFNILQQYFQLNGNSKEQQMNIVNGQTRVSNSWILLLTATKEGSYQIPSFKVGNDNSQPFQITVKPVQVTPQNNGNQLADFLLIGEVSNSEPYVKSEVIYSLKLMYMHPIRSGQVSRLNITNLPTKTITKDKRYATRYKNKQYQVIEWRFAFIPRISGDLKIPQITFQGNVQPPSGVKNIRLITDPITLKVKPQAPEWAQINSDWLPAKNLNIWEKWQPSVDQWIVGNRYRREIKLDAFGVEAKQISDLNINLQAKNYSLYPQKPSREEGLNEQGHNGKYSHQIDYVPNQAGIINLPEIKIPWWDTQKEQLRYAILPSRQITVLPNPNLNSATSQNSTSTNINSNDVNDNYAQSTSNLKLDINDIDINSIDPALLASLQKQLNHQTGLSSIFNLSSSTQLYLLVLILIYSLIILWIGIWIGQKRDQSSTVPDTSTPASLEEAIKEIQKVLKKNKSRQIHVLYQLMLRCYNKHQRKLSLELIQQWLKQIEQLRVITQNGTTEVDKTLDVNALDELLKSSIKHHNTKTDSPLPSLYPSTN